MRLGLIAIMVAACACTRGGAAPPVRDGPASIRFAIEVGREVTGPIYVALTGDGGPGWVWATRDGQRVHFRERCDIPDCGMTPAVCGAPVPLVRDLAAGEDRRVEFVWDGMVSAVDTTAGGCETRRPAPPGTYVATLCFSREADLQGAAESAAVRQGYVVRPACVERSFTLADREVVLRI